MLRRISSSTSMLLTFIAVTLVGPPMTHAAMAFRSIDVGSFALDPGTTFSNQAAALQAVEATGAVTVLDANQVLATSGRTGSAGLCHATGLSSSLKPGGFCWDHADDVSNSYTAAGGWTPQGITGSYDAQPNGLWDNVATRHTAYMASWHFDRLDSTGKLIRNEFARVTMVNANNNAISYNHLLLVQPYINGSGAANFRAMPGTHADGMVWYGNTLFVANGRFLQVYSLKHIWKVNSNQEMVGISGSTSSARWSNYALPLIGQYRTTTSDGTACTAAAGRMPCLNSLSLDRTGQDGLVSAEYYGAAGGRVVRWPLDYQSMLPATTNPDAHGAGVTHPTLGYVSPVWHMQGAATNGTHWYLVGDCPSGVGGGSGDSINYSCIHRALPDNSPHVYTTSPVLSQNIGYSPATKRLWGINERINSARGIRVVFSIDG
ncbi:hypothetical protein C8A03DRAFT_19858 [Achaetomium macrosporum]|uniref:Secreted protein n=1 Tax=Achaetomium macrosporum TaxID=79813 RepID=A0AAN7H632_9PEZI|nr:hypothetical protein C8A03DRAFT_19858 [Achaetomium macrosporum]